MRKPFLALLPASLALIGAAPAPHSPAEMAECRLTHDEMVATAAAVPVNRVDDTSEPPQRSIVTYFKGTMPTVFGYPVFSYGTTDMIDDSERLSVISVIAGPYADIRARVLKLHGDASCEERPGDEGKVCFGVVEVYPGWKKLLMLKNAGNRTSLNCAYFKTED